MAIVVTITADTPAQLAPMWAGLGGHTATVNLDADHMWIDVDMRHTDEDGAEPFAEQEPGEDLVDQLAPIATDDEPEDQADHYDGHTVDVGQVEVSEPEADVVPIDSGARAKHPAAKAVDADSCAGAILAALAAEPTVEFTVMDIVLAVDGYKESTIKFTTAQLTRDGQIARVGRGLYRAVPAS